MTQVSKAKPFLISKRKVVEAWLCVKRNQGTHGIDGVTLKDFEQNLKDNLYKIWNRLSSGTYFPPPVKRVEIPKSDGKVRPLGIPTVADRVAQMTVKREIEAQWDVKFHRSSFGYRRGKSAHEAVAQAKMNCFKYKWVVDLDIKGFFDNINHDLMIKAIDKQHPPKWVRLALTRWLKADTILPDGSRQKGEQGTPQGGVISPLLANLFLHYTFDKWMERQYPQLPFERYADDAIIHCRTEAQANSVLAKLNQRMTECQLTLHPEKTKIVCCDPKINKGMTNNQFDFLGFTFRRRGSYSAKTGEHFTGFLPAISDKAKQAIRQKIKSFAWRKWQSLGIDRIATLINPYLRGIINYYSKFYGSALYTIWRTLDARLVLWIMKKRKTYHRKKSKAYQLIEKLKSDSHWGTLFAHWGGKNIQW